MNSPNSAAEADQTPKPVPAPSGRWVRIALAISLAVNLAIAGIVTGAMFRSGGPGHGGTMARDVGFGPFTEALSKEDRSELRRAFLAAAPDMRESRRAIRADFNELLLQLRASPFDENALRMAVERQNARNIKRLELGQRLLIDLVLAMSPEERQAFADRLEQSLTRGPRSRDAPAAP